MILVYLIGVPGSGKTTITREALRLTKRPPVIPTDFTVPHERFGDIWHLGQRRAPFGGTDALSMSIQPKAVAWIHHLAALPDDGRRPRVLLAEGDRLANLKFFNSIPHEVSLCIIHLDLPLQEAKDRARRRADEWGFKVQNATWWKGRATKVYNLAYSRPVNHWDATQPIHELGCDLANLILTAGLPAPLTRQPNL